MTLLAQLSVLKSLAARGSAYAIPNSLALTALSVLKATTETRTASASSHRFVSNAVAKKTAMAMERASSWVLLLSVTVTTASPMTVLINVAAALTLSWNTLMSATGAVIG